MKTTLFEFTFYDKKNIPRNRLLTIVEEEVATEAKQQNWHCEYQIVEAHSPIRQMDGALRYGFRVVAYRQL